MKILLDENLPHALRAELAEYDVFTVSYLGWKGVRNGNLLRKAAEFGFDALATQDWGMQYEQNVANLPLSIIVMQAKSNDMEDLGPLVPELKAALASVEPRTLTRVGLPKPPGN